MPPPDKLPLWFTQEISRFILKFTWFVDAVLIYKDCRDRIGRLKYKNFQESNDKQIVITKFYRKTGIFKIKT